MKNHISLICLFLLFGIDKTFAQSCNNFQFDFCSVRVPISPNSATGEVSITGPATSVMSQNPYTLKVLNQSGQVVVPYNIRNFDNGTCQTNRMEVIVYGLKSGSYRMCFQKTNQLSCVDTVPVTIGPGLSCDFRAEVESKKSPSSPGATDGRILLRAGYHSPSLENLADQSFFHPVVWLSKNGGPFVKPPRIAANSINNWVRAFQPQEIRNDNICNSTSFPGNPNSYGILCNLGVGTYRLAVKAGYDTVCVDTVSFTITPNPCDEFKFDLCSVSPTANPNQPGGHGKVVFKSAFKTDNGDNYVSHQIFRANGTQVPNSTLSNLFRFDNTQDIYSNCDPSESWSMPFPAFNYGHGDFYSVISTQFGGVGCRDTVSYTIPDYSCIRFLDSVQKIQPSTAVSNDGRITVHSAIGFDESYIGISKDGGPFTSNYRMRTGCLPSVDCPPLVDDPHDPPPFTICDPGEARKVLKICYLLKGNYRIALRYAYDSTCKDTIAVQLSAPASPCDGFQFELCSVSPTAKPAVFGKKVVFSSSHMPGLPEQTVQNKTFNANWQENYDGSNAVFKLNTNQPSSSCSENSIWGFTINALAIPSGNYYEVFTNQTGTCKDTVPFTIPDYPCTFQVDSVKTKPASGPNAQDGFVLIVAASNLKQKKFNQADSTFISMDGGPYLKKRIKLSCLSTDDFCTEGNPNDWPPFDNCGLELTSSYLGICGLAPGRYKVLAPYGWSSDCFDTVAFEIGPIPSVDTVAKPLFSLPSGTYSGNQTLTLSASAGASIYYTDNGNLPNLTTPNGFTKLYNAPILLSQNRTIRALAVAGGVQSAIVVRYYTITNPQVVSAPTLSLPGGTYSGIQTVSISTNTPGAAIWFTTNGMVPVPGSTTAKLYNRPFSLIASATVRAVGVLAGYVNSPITVANYILTGVQTVAAPSFSPGPGVYGIPQNITITCGTAGARIFYTTNGMTPFQGLFAAREYSTPVNIALTRTLKARAFLTGSVESAVSVGNYTIGAIRKSTEREDHDFYLLSEGAENDMEEGLSVFPNPSNTGLFEVSGLNVKILSVRVLNALGQRVEFQLPQQLNESSLQINLRDLSSGIYLLQIQTESGLKEVKLMK